jgi:2-iminobutanoate/2-iminopropanoate deaminase
MAYKTKGENPMKKIIQTTNAPKAIGPYSQAIQTDKFLFISGQLPIDPETGAMEPMDITLQTRRSLMNVAAIIQAAEYPLDTVIKCTVYMKDLSQFADMNQAYQTFFGNHKPTRVAVEVARLPKDALVEIDAICVK